MVSFPIYYYQVVGEEAVVAGEETKGVVGDLNYGEVDGSANTPSSAQARQDQRRSTPTAAITGRN